MKTIQKTLNISGMHCSGCADRVQQVLSNLQGVRSAKVSLEEERAEVIFDEDQTGVTRMKEVVENAGYEANIQS